jgi:hypothetical protein
MKSRRWGNGGICGLSLNISLALIRHGCTIIWLMGNRGLSLFDFSG